MPQSDRNNGLFHCLLQARDGEVHHGKQTGGQARTVRRGYLRAASHKPRQQAMELKLPDIDHVWIMCLNNCCFAQRAACIRGQTVHTPLADSWFEVRRGKKKKLSEGMFSFVFATAALVWKTAFNTASFLHVLLIYFQILYLVSGYEWTCCCGTFSQQNILLVHAFKRPLC